MSLNKDGTYIEHVTSNGRRTGWECYRRGCTKIAVGQTRLPSGSVHRACPDHSDKSVCVCGALEFGGCFCNLTVSEFFNTPGKRDFGELP